MLTQVVENEKKLNPNIGQKSASFTPQC